MLCEGGAGTAPRDATRPSYCSTSARGNCVVSGIQLGNVFIGVQVRLPTCQSVLRAGVFDAACS